VGVFLISSVQLSLLPNFHYLSFLNLPLVVLLLISFISNKKTVALWFISMAFVMDIWSFEWFGANILIYTIVLIITFLALNNFLTNKSLYSYLFLLILASLIFDFYWTVVFIWPSPMVITKSEWILELKKITANLSAGIIIYYVANFLGHSLQSVVLVRRKI
jgi:hypothetical protein